MREMGRACRHRHAGPIPGGDRGDGPGPIALTMPREALSALRQRDEGPFQAPLKQASI